jgi:hypothetical protein
MGAYDYQHRAYRRREISQRRPDTAIDRLDWLPELALICHCEAVGQWRVLGSEKADDRRVGVRLTPVAPLAGETLLAVSGGTATAIGHYGSGVTALDKRMTVTTHRCRSHFMRTLRPSRRTMPPLT